jgi:primosomal protein N' (replication factor Y)
LTAQSNEQFFEQELELRQALGYPPFERWVRLLAQGRTKRRVREECENIARQLRSAGLDLLGPSPCPYAKVGSRYRYHLVVRLRDSNNGFEAIRAIQSSTRSNLVKVTIDADPLVTV